ncbi:MAG: glutamate ligase domain-containing protein, partial [Persicimonas sp.]
FVDYAHSPDALERALETLAPLTKGRLWVVFGCGGDRDTEKRAPMGRVARRVADLVIVTSDNPRTESPEAIIDDILEGIGETSGDEVVVEVDRGRAIDRAVRSAASDDVVLVAGKGHEGYQEIDGAQIPFDDVERVQRALESRSEGVDESR